MTGPMEVSWAQFALYYKALVGRALPASPDHRLRGTRCRLEGEPKSCARLRALLSALLWRLSCYARPHRGVDARCSTWSAACVRDFWSARSS